MDYLVNGTGRLVNLLKPTDKNGTLHVQGSPCDGGKDSAKVELTPRAIDIRRVLDLWESRIALHDNEQRQRDVMSEEEAIETRDADPQNARYMFLVAFDILLDWSAARCDDLVIAIPG